MSTIKATTNAEILSYFINSDPELSEELDLPIQGESTKELGKLIMDTARYKNKLINTVNLIGLTIIKENRWENPWQRFTDKGRLRWGQQIREIIMDLAQVYDYNANYDDKDKFLETAVPDVMTYIHQINFQKVYEVTVNDGLLRMAFEDEDNGLYNFINNCVSNLYETYEYDKYQIDKYQLCRRIVDGTVPVKVIDTSGGARSILAQMKGVSNLMSFKSPNYNPAGVRRGTKLENQYLLIDATREGINSTEIYATSYFLNEAQAKTNSAMIDSFSTADEARLAKLLGSDYTPFTSTEKSYLTKILGVAFADDFFMDYYYALDNSADGKEQTEWRNPSTLDRTIFLHAQLVVSTSPYANICCFIANDSPAISEVDVQPSTATVTKGNDLKLSATVTATNFANKSVAWEVEQSATTNKATINQSGVLHVPADYNTTGSGTAAVYTITIPTILETGDVVKVNGVSYTVDASSQDTIAKQITAMKSAINDAKITDFYAISGTSTTTTLTEKSGLYGKIGAPAFEFIPASGSDGECEIAETTAGVLPANQLVVKATSVYDKTKFDTSVVTVS